MIRTIWYNVTDILNVSKFVDGYKSSSYLQI